MKVNIIDMDHLGNGIGKIDNKIIFIPKSVTGDVCDIEIHKEYKNYSIGKIKNIVKNSAIRKDHQCPYYNECGGCNISNLDYQEQLKFKANKVKNVFRKYLDIDIMPNVIGSEKTYGYRNKITYHKDASLGLISEFGGVLDIANCLLVSDRVNELYNDIKKLDLTKVKLVTIRECDNGLILIVDGKIDFSSLKDKCILIMINNEIVHKIEDGYIKIKELKYKISPKAFFQINTANISALYDEIIRRGEFNKEEEVIDLYCGVGSISLYISAYVKSVLGIEIIPEAINDAKENMKLNKIKNAKFICGDVSKLIDDNIDCDTLIVDPPRAGLDKHTVNVINEKMIKKLIYVSCDVMTLVRDIKVLTNYKLKKISVIDMFPGTHHCESITVLERR